jgi:hypothetical protein
MKESVAEVLAASDVVIVGNKNDEFKAIEAQLRPGQIVLDLVRIFGDRPSDESYQGICW